MPTKELIDAIYAGNSQEIERTFDQAMAGRIVQALDARRLDIAQNMFRTEDVEQIDEAWKVAEVNKFDRKHDFQCEHPGHRNNDTLATHYAYLTSNVSGEEEYEEAATAVCAKHNTHAHIIKAAHHAADYQLKEDVEIDEETGFDDLDETVVIGFGGQREVYGTPGYEKPPKYPGYDKPRPKPGPGKIHKPIPFAHKPPVSKPGKEQNNLSPEAREREKQRQRLADKDKEGPSEL